MCGLLFTFSASIIRALCLFVYITRSVKPSNSIPTISATVTVHTTLGSIVGFKQGIYNVYLGIPFAEPPIGKYRFRPTVPKRPWHPLIYNAFNYSAECLQSTLYAEDTSMSGDKIHRDEDCLYLNIWQPSRKPKDALLPVMIWIYGGAFLHGGASKPEYEGNKMAEKGVIVVSFNYRLGALGFLVSISDGLFGNYGLDDQKTAIEWVHNNIQRFGGDPNRVTLFGESAGAMSIGMHFLDQEHNHPATSHPSSQQLFHGVILQSNPMGYKYRSLSVADFLGKDFRKFLDCEDLKCLQSESAEEIMHSQDTVRPVPRSIGDFFTWGPVLTDNSFYREVRLRPGGPLANITVHQPIETIKDMQALNIPVIIGTNSNEGNVFVFTAYPTRMPKIIYQGLVFSFFRTSAPQVLRMYAPMAKKESNKTFPDFRLVLSQIIGDYLFRCPNQYFAQLLSLIGTPIFHYEFALATRTPGFPCCDGLACHTCELPYVFHHLDIIGQDYSYYEETLFYMNESDPPPLNYLTMETGEEGEEAMVDPLQVKQKVKRQEDRTSAYHVADIFGAASSLFGGNLWMKNASQGVESRTAIDYKVSHLIMDYWVTFAKDLDPNGIRSIQGYNVVTGSRPDGNVWWPQLFGQIKSNPSSTGSAVGNSTPSDIPTPSMSSWRSHDEKFQKRLFGEDRGTDEAETEAYPNSYYQNEEEAQIDEMYLNKWEDARSFADRNDDIKRKGKTLPSTEGSTEDRNQLKVKPSIEKYQSALQRNEKKLLKMHQMLFDAETTIEIIANDCICNAWNKMEYKF